MPLENQFGSLALEATLQIAKDHLAAVETLLGGTGKVGLAPRTTGGLDCFRSLDLDETEEAVKVTAGQVYGWYFYNDGATEVYVKLYNATVANVTVGSTVPKMTLPVPAGAGANVEFGMGIPFSTAISAAATLAVADADTTAPGANQLIANIFYA